MPQAGSSTVSPSCGSTMLDHELGDGARRVELAGVAGALQVAEDLLVDVAEQVAVGRLVEVDVSLSLLMTWRSSVPDFM